MSHTVWLIFYTHTIWVILVVYYTMYSMSHTVWFINKKVGRPIILSYKDAVIIGAAKAGTSEVKNHC